MTNIEFNDDSKFLFYGDTYDGIAQFADEYSEGDIKKAKPIIEVLLRKGEMQVLEVKSPKDKCFEQTAKEEMIARAVESLDLEAEMSKNLKANKKRENRLTYPGIEVTVNSYADALKLMNYCQQTLRLMDVSINVDALGNHVIIKNLTDAEMNAINRYYMGMNVTAGIQTGMQKSVDTLTKSIDYTAQQVITPAAQIGVKGVVSIFKSLAKVGARVGSTAITATSKGIQQTKEELLSDPDVLRATNELINAKDAVKRKTTGIGTVSGIKMLSQ